MKNKKLLVVAMAAMVLILGFLIAVKVYKSSEAQRIGFIAQKNFNIFVRDHAPKLGSLEPKVYLVEFLDPECETCRTFYPLVKNLLKEYEGKIQLIIRYAPFHGNSIMVIKILEAARKQDKYWETLEVLFKYQPQWGGHHNPQPELIWTFLPEAGVDVEKIRVDMNDVNIQKNLLMDQQDGQALGVRRTPQFFINGRPLERFGLEFLKEEIEKDL